jgi:hypothetical protein
MSGDFNRLIRGLIREAIIASSSKPKHAKKIQQKARITQKNSRYIPKAIFSYNLSYLILLNC